MASFLVFWGGIQNGFWGFSHNPTEYAKEVKCPALLLYGEKDKRVSHEEIDLIYKNLAGEKKLKIYPLAGHENFITNYGHEWKTDVHEFLSKYIMLQIRLQSRTLLELHIPYLL